MGRPRESDKHMPPGMRLVDGRWHWRPTNAATRLVMERLAPGKKGIPAGEKNDDKDEVRKWWAVNVAAAAKEEVPDDLPEPGTIAELLERARRDLLPTLGAKTRLDWVGAKGDKGYLKTLLAEFGRGRYAKSEQEAASGKFLRAMDLTNYLDRQLAAKRPVAGNREIQALARIFKKAKSRWGYTEFNPCLGVEYNDETPRRRYQTDDAFMKVYEKARPLGQVILDLMQVGASRRGMLLRANLGDIKPEGLLLTLNKKKKGEAARQQLLRFVDDKGKDTGLREILDRALELRAKVRGGGKVADLDTAPLFLNRRGKRITETGYNSMMQRSWKRAGFKAHEFHGHDVRVKSMSDSPTVADAQDRGGHIDGSTTRAVYRAKPIEVVPLKRVSKKA